MSRGQTVLNEDTRLRDYVTLICQRFAEALPILSPDVAAHEVRVSLCISTRHGLWLKPWRT